VFSGAGNNTASESLIIDCRFTSQNILDTSKLHPVLSWTFHIRTFLQD